MKTPFVPAIIPPARKSVPSLWFAFCKRELLVYDTHASVPVPLKKDFAELALPVVQQQFLGFYDGTPCYSVGLPENCQPPAGMTFKGLRKLLLQFPADYFGLAGRALQIVEWDRNTQYCGRCGATMEKRDTERSKECPRCSLVNFPQISPAVIVLIIRENRLLLAHSAHFPEGMYSILAGFVEPGETLEETVEREVLEEVGIRVKHIRYFGSQSWPFPNSLMIGFTAEYAGGKIRIDHEEIVDAGWYTADKLPMVPGTFSIAGRLIKLFIDQQEKTYF